jgi:hypothetical protein
VRYSDGDQLLGLLRQRAVGEHGVAEGFERVVEARESSLRWCAISGMVERYTGPVIYCLRYVMTGSAAAEQTAGGGDV